MGPQWKKWVLVASVKKTGSEFTLGCRLESCVLCGTLCPPLSEEWSWRGVPSGGQTWVLSLLTDPGTVDLVFLNLLRILTIKIKEFYESLFKKNSNKTSLYPLGS